MSILELVKFIQTEGIETLLNFGVLGVIAFMAFKFVSKQLPNLATKEDYQDLKESMRAFHEMNDHSWDYAKKQLPSHFETQKHIADEMIKITDKLAMLLSSVDSNDKTLDKLNEQLTDVKESLNELLRLTDKLLYTFQYTLDPKQILERFRNEK